MNGSCFAGQACTHLAQHMATQGTTDENLTPHWLRAGPSGKRVHAACADGAVAAGRAEVETFLRSAEPGANVTWPLGHVLRAMVRQSSTPQAAAFLRDTLLRRQVTASPHLTREVLEALAPLSPAAQHTREAVCLMSTAQGASAAPASRSTWHALLRCVSRHGVPASTEPWGTAPPPGQDPPLRESSFPPRKLTRRVVVDVQEEGGGCRGSPPCHCLPPRPSQSPRDDWQSRSACHSLVEAGRAHAAPEPAHSGRLARPPPAAMCRPPAAAGGRGGGDAAGRRAAGRKGGPIPRCRGPVRFWRRDGICGCRHAPWHLPRAATAVKHPCGRHASGVHTLSGHAPGGQWSRHSPHDKRHQRHRQPPHTAVRQAHEIPGRGGLTLDWLARTWRAMQGSGVPPSLTTLALMLRCLTPATGGSPAAAAYLLHMGQADGVALGPAVQLALAQSATNMRVSL